MNENRNKMVIEVEGLVRRLNELNSNIDLFPSELSGFSKQAAKDARTFFWLSLIPIMLIATMFYLLVHGAADLTTKITGSENVNILALAVSRAPYVAVASAIIAASYYLAKMLMLEIVRISRQRLSLTKISIIAKDVSSSIDSDLDLPRDERYALRLRLKMDLMRDYMKDYLSKEFAPTLPKRISAYQSIFARNVDDNEAPVSE